MIGLVFSLGSRRLARRRLHGDAHLATASASARRRSSWPRSSDPTTLLIAFAPTGNAAIPFLVVAQLLFGFTVVVYNIVQVSYRQAICPPRLQGRMNSVMRFIVWGTIPLGGLLGGALGTTIGLRETIVVGAIGGGLAVPLDPALAAAPSARDARADRRRRRDGAGARGSATVTECLSFPRSRPGCASSTRSSRARRSRRPARRTSRRSRPSIRRSPSSTVGASRARGVAARTSSSRSRTRTSSSACTS